MRTVSPACSFARSRSAAHDDIPGFAIAAASSAPSASGIANQCPSLTMVRSAIAPYGDSGMRKYTRWPSSMTPVPSIPGMNGSALREL